MADCYLPSTSGRGGYVVYQGYRGCFNSWLVPPGFALLPTWALAIMYLILLLYMFVGVAVSSDRFMESIEVICASTRKARQKCPITGQIKVTEVPVWNWVVANVSLMAVGSSAPEILLAVVESILRLGRPAGELGPSTIVGSAAYNLLMIAAVCTLALPIGTIKRIQHMRVFVTTAVISLWAYVWMLIVYLWWTPNEVTVAEAALTLLQFVLLLVVAWAVDVRVWYRLGWPRQGSVVAEDCPAIVPVSDADAQEAGTSCTKGLQGSLAQMWRQQFVDALEYSSTAAEGADEPGGASGLVVHFLSIFWKLCLATVPPAHWWGGWPCFVGSLVWIIAQVVLVDEVATLLGCVMGLKPLVIGMSLVALGTSLPDTFCSRTAALKDDTADAAVGNVTGSNAANVFLGLGLPWLISSCYYAARGQHFCSDSGALAFSVLVFTGAALVWLAVLAGRRVVAGGELGAGSFWGKWGIAAIAVGLWVAYLTLTALVAEGRLSDAWIAARASSGACSTTAVSK